MPTFGYYMADLSRTKTASHGIINYSLGLLTALSRLLEPEERLVVFGSEEMRTEFSHLLPASAAIEWYPTATVSSTRARLVGDHFHSLRWARDAGADVIHFPKGFIPLWKSRGLRTVATIHDDIPVRYAAGDFGEDSVSWTARYFAWQIKHSLRRADAVLAVSDFTKERLEALQVSSAATVNVTYEGVLSLVTAHEHVWPKKPRLLIMGSVHPHKQTRKTVADALRYLEETDSDLELLVLGRLLPDVEAMIRKSDRASSEPRLLDSEELVGIVAESAALLFGSAYEGFGLPPLEAALLCTPVAYRRASAAQEVMAGTHFSFEEDYDSFAAAVDAALAVSEAALKGYKNTLAQRYNWVDIGQRTLETYRSLV